MKLDSNEPTGDIANRWDKHRFDMKLVNPANKRKLSVIVVGSGLAGASASATMAELGYNVDCFCFKIAPAARTPSQHRVESTQRKTTKTTATASTDSSTTRLKAVTFALENQTSIDSPRSVPISSTNAWLRACPSHGITVVTWRTVRSVARRSAVLSTLADKPASSFCWCLRGTLSSGSRGPSQNAYANGDAGLGSGQRPCPRHRHPSPPDRQD